MTTAKEADATTLTLLFVDDEPAVIRAISRLLATRTGFRMLTAASGEEALDLLRTHNVDVLVSDIDMPKMNGLELVRRARQEFPSTLRILLTGAATMARAVDAINEGEVVRFFAKPFDAATFIRALDDLGARILKLRRERHVDAKRERCDEFFRWVEERYPGTLAFERGDDGATLIDAARLEPYLSSAPAEVRALLSRD
jgi:CheY-like chemotaxis protein